MPDSAPFFQPFPEDDQERPHRRDYQRGNKRKETLDNLITQDRQLEYTPREHFLPFHQRNTRWACLVAHRRAGKTLACVNELIIRALYTHKKRARYGYIAPFYSQAKQVAWTYLKDFAKPFINSSRDIRESELSVTLFNGAVIRLYGADNPDALRGVYFDGVILDEYGDCRPSLWGEVILPTLADRKGWAVFIGTPKGKNHFFDIHLRSVQEPNWYHLVLKASESQILPQSELDEMRAQQTDAQYQQELECDFTAAVLGTYYANIIAALEQKSRIRPDYPQHDPSLPVSVAADLGYKDQTALWFWQHAPDGAAIIDYEEHHTKPLVFYFDLLDEKPYRYEKIWLPHDARAKTLQTGRSTVEQFIDPPQVDQYNSPLANHRDPYPVSIAPHLKKQQGIDAVRLVLQACWFNQQTCYAGIEALRSYRRRWDEVNKTFANEPLHDWASDGADAFRYFALVVKDRLPTVQHQKPTEPLIKPPEYTLDQLFEDREGSHGFDFERIRV